MTACLSQQTVSVKDTAGVRKRRRRAPAGGAADDCFACSKKNVKCDRRRPYCSQCLELGKECSGYKTQLTWGVGVASRGKLRGLSLPVARAPPVSREPKKTPPVSCSQVQSTATLTEAHWAEQQEPQRHAPHPHPHPPPPQQQQQQPQQQQPHAPIEISSLIPSAPTSAHSYVEPGDYGYFAAPTHHDTSPHDIQNSWGSMSYSSGLLQPPDPTPKYSRFSLPLDTDGLSSSSVGSVSDADYFSPLSQTYSRDEMSFGSASPIIFDGYPGSQHSPATHSPPLEILLGHHPHTRLPNSCPDLLYTAASEHGSNLDSHPDPFEAHLNPKLMRECDGLGEHHMVPCPAFPF
ncbi:hypothetical protein E4U53_003449 [Claviceps sorghi]|nr:hypothetical protein E4U53_003449 [Claviceps sorghi]